jgi:hypothetical protein
MHTYYVHKVSLPAADMSRGFFIAVKFMDGKSDENKNEITDMDLSGSEK